MSDRDLLILIIMWAVGLASILCAEYDIARAINKSTAEIIAAIRGEERK